MKTVRIIIAFLQALFPLIGFGFISVVVYSDLSKPFNIIIALVFFIIGLFSSRSIFNMMRRRGVISVLSGNNATYNLDELNPTSGSGVFRLTPEELTNLFFENKLNFNQGTTVSIWGDWEGRQLDTRHHINDLTYNSENNILTIIFSDNCLLIITTPSIILYSTSYLKIIKAKEIIWEVPVKTNSKNQYIYLNTGEKIKTKSNTNWTPHKYDLGIGMNALYLQG